MTQSPTRHHRSWWLVCILAFTALWASSVPAQPAPPPAASPIMVPNPSTDLWRAVRQREAAVAGRTQVQGVQTGVLIQKSGEDFRNYRREDFIGPAGMVLGGAAVLVLLFYFARGEIPIPDGRSGKKIRRFPDFDRVLHWFTAILFIFLALTGLTLLFGRFFLLPVIGPEAFAVIASACKEGHNLFGPLFLFSVLGMLIRWGSRNLPHAYDLKWILKGGGIIGTAHVSAGFFNAGEKIWFWSVILLGATVTASGLVLLFPVFGQAREIMQLALVVHGIVAVLFIAGSFGHIYIGTLGTQGSLESMTTGYVDENWAQGHHDLWHKQATGAQASSGAATDKKTHVTAEPGAAAVERT
ncbi:MAG: formate dehydrogenase subunit gamma [Gammaproteobacteria bacterium]|nr:formate dehydrogenase subunit gamma [Gammaproteobacteria bacterium]